MRGWVAWWLLLLLATVGSSGEREGGHEREQKRGREGGGLRTDYFGQVDSPEKAGGLLAMYDHGPCRGSKHHPVSELFCSPTDERSLRRHVEEWRDSGVHQTVWLTSCGLTGGAA